MTSSRANLLLVEGPTDLVAIAEFAEGNGIAWPKGTEPITIKPLGSKTPQQSIVEGHLNATGLKNLGVILDADDDALETWKLIQSWFASFFADLPEMVPEGGFVSEVNLRGQRLGVWIMPDNRSGGTLETLLKKLVRADSDAVLQHAVSTCDSAKQIGALFKKVHEEKAHIFTWLAWQDQPARNLKTIDFHNVFNPQSEHVQPFIAWLRKLFNL